jgi:hypothetical protein
MSILDVALDPATVIVAVDPGKVLNRVWLSSGGGLLVDPVSLPVSRAGSYAARRRDLACRPPALGRLHGAHESLPHHGA